MGVLGGSAYAGRIIRERASPNCRKFTSRSEGHLNAESFGICKRDEFPEGRAAAAVFRRCFLGRNLVSGCDLLSLSLSLPHFVFEICTCCANCLPSGNSPPCFRKLLGRVLYAASDEKFRVYV